MVKDIYSGQSVEMSPNRSSVVWTHLKLSEADIYVSPRVLAFKGTLAILESLDSGRTLEDWPLYQEKINSGYEGSVYRVGDCALKRFFAPSGASDPLVRSRVDLVMHEGFKLIGEGTWMYPEPLMSFKYQGGSMHTVSEFLHANNSSPPSTEEVIEKCQKAVHSQGLSPDSIEFDSSRGITNIMVLDQTRHKARYAKIDCYANPSFSVQYRDHKYNSDAFLKWLRRKRVSSVNN